MSSDKNRPCNKCTVCIFRSCTGQGMYRNIWKTKPFLEKYFTIVAVVVGYNNFLTNIFSNITVTDER